MQPFALRTSLATAFLLIDFAGCATIRSWFAKAPSPSPSDPSVCTPLRLDQARADGSPGSMQSVEVRDQGEYGICYAEVATELTDAYRFGGLKDPNTWRQSAVMSAAVGLDFQNGTDPFRGGHTCKVFDYIAQNGFHDSFAVTKCILKLETPTLVKALEELYYDFQTQLVNERNTLYQSGKNWDDPSSPFPQFEQQLKTQMTPKVVTWLDQAGIPADSRPSSNVIDDLWDLSELRFIWGIVTYQCYKNGESYPVKLPACRQQDLSSGSINDVLTALNGQLNAPAMMPVEIDYCADVLTVGSSSPGFDHKSLQCARDSSGNSSAHASLVIGRRLNPATAHCEYLVRNSWGSSCERRAPPVTLPPWIKSDPTLNLWVPEVQTGSVYASEWSCERGSVWIDAEALARSIFNISALSP